MSSRSYPAAWSPLVGWARSARWSQSEFVQAATRQVREGSIPRVSKAVWDRILASLFGGPVRKPRSTARRPYGRMPRR